MAKPSDPAMKAKKPICGEKPPSLAVAICSGIAIAASVSPAIRSPGRSLARNDASERKIGQRCGVCRRLPWPSLLRSLRTNVFGNIPLSCGQKPAVSRRVSIRRYFGVSIKVQGERTPAGPRPAGPALVGSELELAGLRRAARELEVALVLSRRRGRFLGCRAICVRSAVRLPADCAYEPNSFWSAIVARVLEGFFIRACCRATASPASGHPAGSSFFGSAGLRCDRSAIVLSPCRVSRSSAGPSDVVEGDHGTVRLDDRAAILLTSRACSSRGDRSGSRQRDRAASRVKRLDEHCILRRREQPGLGPRQTGNRSSSRPVRSPYPRRRRRAGAWRYNLRQSQRPMMYVGVGVASRERGRWARRGW